MNKKIMLILVTAFLSACNVLTPPMTESTPETIVPPPTESAPQTCNPQEVTSTGFTTVRLHPGDGDLQTMLAQEAHRATTFNLMPVVEFDAIWCPPCQVIDEGLQSNNELLLDAYAGTYIIKLDVDEWGWGDSDLHDFDFDGIPVYFKLDAQGQPTGKTIDGRWETILRMRRQWMSFSNRYQGTIMSKVVFWK
jgi:thiol-disulfide isomerase/thioredoxin